MLLPVFHDLIKPQWRAVIEALKLNGGLPVSELAQRSGASYMAVKQHCEELFELGYLDRSRMPRTAVGRPEIFYSLAAKADVLFPQAGAEFTLALLDELRGVAGENAPERVLFLHFEKQEQRWRPVLDKEANPEKRVSKLLALRGREGCFIGDDATATSWTEYHHPLQRIFERYPRAVTMELRLLERLLGRRVNRKELDSGRNGQPRVCFEILAAG